MFGEFIRGMSERFAHRSTPPPVDLAAYRKSIELLTRRKVYNLYLSNEQDYSANAQKLDRLENQASQLTPDAQELFAELGTLTSKDRITAGDARVEQTVTAELQTSGMSEEMARQTRINGLVALCDFWQERFSDPQLSKGESVLGRRRMMRISARLNRLGFEDEPPPAA